MKKTVHGNTIHLRDFAFPLTQLFDCCSVRLAPFTLDRHSSTPLFE